jgi:type IV pilus assembly protein PilP
MTCGMAARPRARALASWLMALNLAASGLWACGDSADANAAGNWMLPTTSAKAGSAPARAPAAAGPAAPDPMATMRDADFTESEHNRDPFRSFAAEFRPKVAQVAQRAVLMPNTPIESMRLIAIVMGLSQPRAMLTDEKGVGYVTSRGDFVGRADVVQGGGPEGLPVTLNWRIERIRDNEVVLSREDPSAPGRPPLTRVIPLHEAPVVDPEGSAG